MRNFLKRLSKPRGETIVETLAAILIAALSCTILMTTVNAAAMINRSARNSQLQFEKELKEAEAGADGEGTGLSGTVSIKVRGAGGSADKTYKYDAAITGGDKKLTSYELEPTTAGGAG